MRQAQRGRGNIRSGLLQHYSPKCCTTERVRLMLVPAQLTLFDENGARKYLCDSEIVRFLSAARRADSATCSFCCLLVFTGCRVS